MYGIVQQSGGAVHLESTVGEGTTVHVLLPKSDKVMRHVRREPTAPAPTGNATILVVDDELSVREMLSTGLERLGYRILKAGDPLEALDLFRRNPAAVDVLVSDVMMPHMTGSALARQLLSERPELRVVLISGYASDVLEREPPPDDAVVLQKPFTANQVAIQVGVLLQRPAP